ncbi:hypothetical protein AGMMS50276_22190 [Synergistales bacterium]|nr:hypothetical protein AGMMS50276_22190 [Synergistales bacterium]
MEGSLIFGILCVLMLLGFPIAISLGMSAIVAMLLFQDMSLIIFPQRIFAGNDSFPMMAIIFFMVAGELMLQGGISKRLVNVANSFLSKIRGSLALISIVTSAFFGALSGSNLATTAAIGNVMYPEMLKDGTYDKGFSLTIQAVGGTLGTMIPPSIPLVVYGTLTNVSIANLFVGVFLPGIVMCILYCIAVSWIIKGRNMANSKTEKSTTLSRSVREGFWALLTPVIILGGIYSGVFSPTESAAVACGYAFIVGKFIYKELDAKSTYSAMWNATLASAAIMFLCSCASFFGWVLTIQGFPQIVAGYLATVVDTRVAFLILMNIAFLIAGMFVDINTIQLLMIPLVAPVAIALGVNMVQFGVIACINLSLGCITPPFGACLFVASSIDKSVKLESMYKEVIPFCIVGIIGIFIITFIPILSTWML